MLCFQCRTAPGLRQGRGAAESGQMSPRLKGGVGKDGLGQARKPNLQSLISIGDMRLEIRD